MSEEPPADYALIRRPRRRNSGSRNEATFCCFPATFARSLAWSFDPSFDILWCYDAERVRVVGYVAAAAAGDTTADVLADEPRFFHDERRLLCSTELMVPGGGDASGASTRFSDVQLAISLLCTVYGLNLSALASLALASGDDAAAITTRGDGSLHVEADDGADAALAADELQRSRRSAAPSPPELGLAATPTRFASSIGDFAIAQRFRRLVPSIWTHK